MARCWRPLRVARRRDKYKIEFSDTYFKPRKHFFGRATLTQFPQDLAGKRIGVKAKTLFAKYALFINKHLAELNLTPMILTEFDDVTLPAFDKIFAALKQNQIDLTLADDELFITAKQNDTGLTPFQLTGPDLIQAFGHEQFGEGVGVAFRQSDTVLTLDFNRALKAVILNCGTGGYKSIYEKYFKAASSLISHCK